MGFKPYCRFHNSTAVQKCRGRDTTQPMYTDIHTHRATPRYEHVYMRTSVHAYMDKCTQTRIYLRALLQLYPLSSRGSTAFRACRRQQDSLSRFQAGAMDGAAAPPSRAADGPRGTFVVWACAGFLHEASCTGFCKASLRGTCLALPRGV